MVKTAAEREAMNRHKYMKMLGDRCAGCGEPQKELLHFSHLSEELKYFRVEDHLSRKDQEWVEMEVRKCRLLCLNCLGMRPKRAENRRKTALQTLELPQTCMKCGGTFSHHRLKKLCRPSCNGKLLEVAYSEEETAELASLGEEWAALQRCLDCPRRFPPQRGKLYCSEPCRKAAEKERWRSRQRLKLLKGRLEASLQSLKPAERATLAL